MTQPVHGIHCDGCRELMLHTQLSQAIAAAKAAFAALPEARRVELAAKFDLAQLEAQHHATWVREEQP